MGFDLHEFISGASVSATSIINNPIWSALLIVVIILLIMYWVFYDAVNQEDEEREYDPFWRLWVRAGVYTIIAVFGMTFLHYRSVSEEFERKSGNQQLSEIVDVAGMGEPLIGPAGAAEDADPLAADPIAFGTDPELLTADDIIATEI